MIDGLFNSPEPASTEAIMELSGFDQNKDVRDIYAQNLNNSSDLNVLIEKNGGVSNAVTINSILFYIVAVLTITAVIVITVIAVVYVLKRSRIIGRPTIVKVENPEYCQPLRSSCRYSKGTVLYAGPTVKFETSYGTRRSSVGNWIRRFSINERRVEESPVVITSIRELQDFSGTPASPAPGLDQEIPAPEACYSPLPVNRSREM